MRYRIQLIVKTVIIAFFFVTVVPTGYAQTVFGSDKEWTGKETKEERWRKLIDIDMSLPDFKNKKIDQKDMGCKLAKMIEFIQKEYIQATYNRAVSTIRYEQTEDPRIRFSSVD